jgi:hypothetical protein
MHAFYAPCNELIGDTTRAVGHESVRRLLEQSCSTQQLLQRRLDATKHRRHRADSLG